MKNQYVGDINDFHKYGLLRLLTDFGRLRLAVCWMLTADDSRSDGRRIGYLQKFHEFSAHDAELFRALHRIVHETKRRDVGAIADSSILRNAKYFADVLTDDAESRDRWMKELVSVAAKFDVIFFDPDNGLEIRSVRRGRKNSCKFLYHEELAAVASATGASILIYQHFPRENRDVYTRRRAAELRAATGRRVSSFRTGSVVFFLLQRHGEACHFARMAPVLEDRWRGRFIPAEHC